eukprot:584781-Amphidinium_carterae.2
MFDANAHATEDRLSPFRSLQAASLFGMRGLPRRLKASDTQNSDSSTVIHATAPYPCPAYLPHAGVSTYKEVPSQRASFTSQSLSTIEQNSLWALYVFCSVEALHLVQDGWASKGSEQHER